MREVGEHMVGRGVAEASGSRGSRLLGVAAVLGLVALVAAALLSGAQASRTALTAAPPQAAAAAASSSEGTYLPGLSAADLSRRLANRGFGCVGPEPAETGGVRWTCTRRLEAWEHTAVIRGAGPDEVSSVAGTTRSLNGSPLSAPAEDFLSFVAATPFRGADPAGNHAWALWAVSVLQPGGTSIRRDGDAQLQLSSPTRSTRLLQLTPTAPEPALLSPATSPPAASVPGDVPDSSCEDLGPPLEVAHGQALSLAVLTAQLEQRLARPCATAEVFCPEGASLRKNRAFSCTVQWTLVAPAAGSANESANESENQSADGRSLDEARIEVVIPRADGSYAFSGSMARVPTTRGLSCQDFAAGTRYVTAVAYWLRQGRPGRMDLDGNGRPCERVYPGAEVAALWVE